MSKWTWPETRSGEDERGFVQRLLSISTYIHICSTTVIQLLVMYAIQASDRSNIAPKQ